MQGLCRVYAGLKKNCLIWPSPAEYAKFEEDSRFPECDYRQYFRTRHSILLREAGKRRFKQFLRMEGRMVSKMRGQSISRIRLQAIFQNASFLDGSEKPGKRRIKQFLGMEGRAVSKMRGQPISRMGGRAVSKMRGQPISRIRLQAIFQNTPFLF